MPLESKNVPHFSGYLYIIIMLYADGTIILGACQGKGGDFASEESMVFCCILVGL